MPRKRKFAKRSSKTNRKSSGRRYSKFKRRFSKYRKGPRVTTKKIRSLVNPDAVFVKLKFRTWVNWRAGVGASAMIAVFRGNGPWDPDASLGGFGPQGWKAWTAQYNWQVTPASKIRIQLDNRMPNLSGVITVLPSLVQYTGALLTSAPPDQQPFARSMVIAPQVNGNNRSHIVMKGYMTTNKMFAQKGTEDIEPFQSPCTTLPGNQWYWNIVMQEIQGTTAERQLYTGSVEVTYYIKFFRKLTFAQPDTLVGDPATVTDLPPV